MNVIITGNQSFCKYPNLTSTRYAKNPVAATDALIRYDEEMALLEQIIVKSQFPIKTVLSSSGPGLDQAVERWAGSKQLKVKRFKPLWVKDGQRNKKAGFEKLAEMIQAADAAIVILGSEPDKRSLSIIRDMRKKGKPLFVETLTHRG